MFAHEGERHIDVSPGLMNGVNRRWQSWPLGTQVEQELGAAEGTSARCGRVIC